MKRFALVVFAILFGSVVFAQTSYESFVVTPDGLRSSSDETKSYILIEQESLTARELYDRAIRFVLEWYKSSDDAIKAKIEGEYIRFDTFDPEFMLYNNSGHKVKIDALYTTELRFKDGRVRYEITSLTMPNNDARHKYQVLFSGGVMSGYVIYKKNGQLFKPDEKKLLENYFNAQIMALASYISDSPIGVDNNW